MKIGEQIKKYRKMRGMTQRELGRRCGVTGQYIQLLELKKNNNPSFKVIEAIAHALDVTVPELLGYDPQPEPEIIRDITQFTTDELLKEVFRRLKE